MTGSQLECKIECRPILHPHGFQPAAGDEAGRSGATGRSSSSEKPSKRIAPSRSKHQCENALDAVRRNHLGCLYLMGPEKGPMRTRTHGTDSRLLTKDIKGETALHLAVRVNDKAMTKLLMSLAPSLRKYRSLAGETPVVLAAAMGRKELMCELLRGEDEIGTAVLTDSNGTSVLTVAVARDDKEMIDCLLERFGRYLLMLPNRSLVLPVHVAALKGNVSFLRVAVQIEPLVVHCRDEFGGTPALYAAQGGRLAALQFLGDHSNATLHAANNKGMSLLHVSCIAGHVDIVSYLLSQMDASTVTAKTTDSATAVHCAAYHGHTHILEQLIGCLTKKIRKEVLSARDGRGSTALHLAASGNHIEAALFLVESGADPSMHNLQRLTPQEVALIRGHRRLAAALHGAKTAKRKKRVSLALLVQPPSSLFATLTRSGNDKGSIVRVHPLPCPFDLHNLQDKNVDDTRTYNSYSTTERRVRSSSSSLHVKMRISKESYAQTSPMVSPMAKTRAQRQRSSSPIGHSSGYSSIEEYQRQPKYDQRRIKSCSANVTPYNEDDVTWAAKFIDAIDALDSVIRREMEWTHEKDDDDGSVTC